jgi:DNA-binding NarL/FixJ family response regulator
LLSDKVDDVQTVELIRRGVCGILPRRATPEVLHKCVQAIGSGEYWITRRVVSKLLQEVRTGPSRRFDVDQVLSTTSAPRSMDPSKVHDGTNRYNLTRREMQMVRALAEGMTNRDIASDFGISESTVKHHLTSIFDKVGVSSRLELATFATYHGLVAIGVPPVAQPVGA